MKRRFKLKNLDCANCASQIENEAKKIDGVNDIIVNFMTQSLILEADEPKFNAAVSAIRDIVSKIEPGTELV